jgi:serine/threonine-protein kinase RsbW
MHWYEKKGLPPHGAFDLGLAENVRRCKVHLPSDMNEVLKTIASWMKVYGYPKKDVFAVILTVHEAASNAFRHGNRGDPSKPVRITYLVREDEVVIRVEDEGPGFDPEHVPEPYQPDIFGRSGGGLMLMRAYSHWIFFDPPGNRVTFSRRRSRQ